MSIDMHASRLGDITEHRAINWLWEQGFEVFKNCGCSGPVDLIAMDKDGKIILIDVKLAAKSYTLDSAPYRTTCRSQLQKDIGVHLLMYRPELKDFHWMRHTDETTYTRYRDQSVAQYDLDLCDTGC